VEISLLEFLFKSFFPPARESSNSAFIYQLCEYREMFVEGMTVVRHVVKKGTN